VREIRTLRAMWRELETELRWALIGHDRGKPWIQTRIHLRAAAPVLEPTGVQQWMISKPGYHELGHITLERSCRKLTINLQGTPPEPAKVDFGLFLPSLQDQRWQIESHGSESQRPR
jgi:hypothetical protein